MKTTSKKNEDNLNKNEDDLKKEEGKKDDLKNK
jgi:hypothetical protein